MAKHSNKCNLWGSVWGLHFYTWHHLYTNYTHRVARLGKNWILDKKSGNKICKLFTSFSTLFSVMKLDFTPKEKRQRNICTHWRELAWLPWSAGPWPSWVLGLGVSHSPNLQQTAGLIVNIIFLGALVTQRASGFSKIWRSLLVKMFTLFPFYSCISQLHTLLPTLQIKFQPLFPWFKHSSLLLIPPVVSFLLSHLALTQQVQPASESVFIGLPKHFEKPCSVSIARERLDYRKNWIDVDFFHYSYSLVIMSNNTNTF